MIEFLSLIYAEQFSNLLGLVYFALSLSAYLFPVSCGHRNLIVNGRRSKFLQEIPLDKNSDRRGTSSVERQSSIFSERDQV